MRVLYVEDDELLGEATANALKAKYAVDWVRDGEAAVESLRLCPYDLVILDINLPEMSGLDVLRQIRFRKLQAPVLMLTARDTVASRVEGLELGADDYLTKPFDLNELMARSSALIRRAHGYSAPEIVAGDLRMVPSEKSVKFKGEPLQLSAKEFAILEILMINAGKIVTREQIEQGIYNWEKSTTIESNTIEVHISSLRKKIGKDAIETVRGFGYRMYGN